MHVVYELGEEAFPAKDPVSCEDFLGDNAIKLVKLLSAPLSG